MNAKDRLAAINNDIQIFTQDGLRYPSGVWPFKSAVELEQLDHVLPEAEEQIWTFSAEIAHGTSRRDALKCIQNAFNHFVKVQYRDATANLVTTLEPATRKDLFVNACKTFIPAVESCDGLGLDGPLRATVDDTVVPDRIEKEYAKIIDAHRLKKAKAKEDNDKREADKAKEEEAIIAAKPQKHIKDVINTTVEKKLANFTTGMEVDDDANLEEANAAVDALVGTLMPKNDKALKTGKGPSAQDQSSNTTKGNGKAAKGKDKGKASLPTDKGSGKSKSRPAKGFPPKGRSQSLAEEKLEKAKSDGQAWRRLQKALQALV
eukprot:TRINITY_DN27721_c0_g1_i1.p2 TRINITY_DN27721_c0_g1~~TRINITY_DN27721_c0_g1_i1.p2  ORF type:complete len:319 (+),score=86.11 TRINITY_DN27721_c0_g1_i1:1335-2291(+)